MTISRIANMINFDDFYDRYYNEWKAGVITENSVEDLFDLLSGLDIEYSISEKVRFNVECIVSYMLRYKYSKTQSINWIEPIRNNNWELKTWIDIDPKVVDYGCSSEAIEDYIGTALRIIFRPKNVRNNISIEEEKDIAKEFSIKNLGNVDFVEDYLEKYARTDRVKRYLQKKGIYIYNGCRFII